MEKVAPWPSPRNEIIKYRTLRMDGARRRGKDQWEKSVFGELLPSRGNGALYFLKWGGWGWLSRGLLNLLCVFGSLYVVVAFLFSYFFILFAYGRNLLKEL